MKKSALILLMVSAGLMISHQAMAESPVIAPIIFNVKDIVVSDDAITTDSSVFVFPDAIDLFGVVSTATTDSALIWSYYDERGHYSINNTASLLPGEFGALPPADKRIAGPGATHDDPDALDDNPFTITVRNTALSPIGGQPLEDLPGSGLIDAMTDTVILFFSDQDQYTSMGLIIYTEDDGSNRLSPMGGIELPPFEFFSGWVGATELASGGSATFSRTTNALCLAVSAEGDNIAHWTSPYSAIDLIDNTVYEIRVVMSTTQTAENSIPFWDLGISNLDSNGGTYAANAYGANFYFLDNLGSLNDHMGGSQGIGRFRNEFVVFWTPLAVSLPSWRSTSTGAFQVAADAYNDAQLTFRTLDLGSAGYGAASDSGTICMQQLRIFGHNLDTMTQHATVYSDVSLAPGDVAPTGPDTAFTFSGGVLTLAPQTETAWLDSQLDIVPGTGTVDTMDGPQPVESWPIPWPTDVLYLMSVEASIPHASVQNQGIPDLFSVQLEGHVQTYQQSYVLPNVKFVGKGTGGAAMPPIAPATGTYKAFGYTNEPSKSIYYAGLRPHINFMNIAGILPDPATGAVSIHGITVNQVSF